MVERSIPVPAGVLDDALVSAASAAGTPGVQAVMMCDGREVWAASRGLAIRDADDPAVPVTESTLFCYASFGKLILAVLTLHLVEERQLDLDRPIAAYVGDAVAGSPLVTARMLLTHCAGYADVYADPQVVPLFPPESAAPSESTASTAGADYQPDRPYSFEMLSAGMHVASEPGSRCEYSNTGYIVLLHVLAAAVGGEQALEDAVASLVRSVDATLLAEGHLTMHRDSAARERLAHGYVGAPGSDVHDYFTSHGAHGIPTDLYGTPFGDGLFAGTARAGARVLDALFVHQRLLRPATVAQMIAPSPQAISAGGAYGMGTERTVVGDRTWQGHEGEYGGFTTMGATDIAGGVTLFVATNTETGAEPIWSALVRVGTDPS